MQIQEQRDTMVRKLTEIKAENVTFRDYEASEFDGVYDSTLGF